MCSFHIWFHLPLVGDGLSGIGGALLYNEDRKRGSYLQRGCVLQWGCFDGTVRPKDNQGEPSGQELPLCIANALLSSKHKDEVGVGGLIQRHQKVGYVWYGV